MATISQVNSLKAPEEPVVKVNELDIQRVEFIRLSASIFCSIAVFALLVVFVLHNYNPDVSSCLEFAQKQTILKPQNFRPEPLEKILYQMGALVLPLLLWAFYYLVGIVLRNVVPRALSVLYWGLCALSVLVFSGMLFLDFSTPSPYLGVPFHSYCSPLFFYRHPLLYFLLIFPLVLLVSFFASSRGRVFASKYFPMLVYGIAIIQLGVVFTGACFSVYSVETSWRYTVHFNSAFSSVVQVFSGFPLLVDGFRNYYGLYPQLLNPLFPLIGLSVLKFTVVLGLLMVLAYIFLFVVLRLMIKNLWLLFLGFTTLVYFSASYGFLITNDNCYMNNPIRLIFPSAVLFLAALYLLKKKKKLYYPIFIVCSVAILWNLETGIAIMVSWLTVLCYQELFGVTWKQSAKNIIGHIAKGVLILLGVLAVYAVSVFIVCGKFPDYSLYFAMFSLFSSTGYGLLPMPLLHPWHLLVLVYLCGLLYGISALVKKEPSPRSTMILFISVYGVATFGYYQGRSHDWTLMASWKEAFLLLPMFADDCWRAFQERRGQNMLLPHYGIFLVVLLFILSFGFLEFGASLSAYKSNFLSVYRAASGRAKTPVVANLDFIKKHTKKGERILIVSGHQGVYHAESKTHSAFNICLTDMIFAGEYEQFCRVVEDSPGLKIFWEPGTLVWDYFFQLENACVLSCLQDGKLVLVDGNNSMLLLSSPKYGSAREQTPADFLNLSLQRYMGAEGKPMILLPADFLNLSLQRYRAGDFHGCIRAAKAALCLRPDYAVAYNNICAAWNSLGEWNKAVAAGERAVALDPGSALARNNLALARSRAGGNVE